MLRRLVLTLLLAAAGTVLGTAAAFADAGGAGTVSFTEHLHNVVIDQEHNANPCTGDLGTVTLTGTNIVEHLTVNANGFWATFTAEGDATFVPDDSSLPTISGHFAAWDGENGNLQNGTETATFTVHIDGVTAHETAHVNFSASGIGGTTFDKMVLSCH